MEEYYEITIPKNFIKMSKWEKGKILMLTQNPDNTLTIK
jgi:hypothetical protein